MNDLAFLDSDDKDSIGFAWYVVLLLFLPCLYLCEDNMSYGIPHGTLCQYWGFLHVAGDSLRLVVEYFIATVLPCEQFTT